jgi:outer membrane protein assembly factor BamD
MKSSLYKRLCLFFVGICLILLLSGCGVWKHFFGDDDMEPTPAELMSEGLDKFNSGEFEGATELFQKVKDRYPYSKNALEAELKMADALYQRDMFDEAYEEYSEFERLHPKNPAIPYVIYQQGMCFYRQSSTIDRDQSKTLRAREEFERVVKRYKNSPYANMAKRKLRESLVNMAEHELYVGNFYYRTGKYDAAMDRYLYIIDHFPDLGQYYEAIENIKKCREEIAQIKAIEEKEKIEGKSWWRSFKQFVFENEPTY